MFDGLQILSNTTKHDQTYTNRTKQFSVFSLFTPIHTNYVNYNNGKKKRKKNKGKVATCALGITLK